MPLVKTPLELAQEALRDISASSLPPELSRLPKKLQLQALLERKGLGLGEVADNLRFLALAAEKDETRLRASELILRLHDILKEEKTESVPQVVFQIAGEHVNLGFLRPLAAGAE